MKQTNRPSGSQQVTVDLKIGCTEGDELYTKLLDTMYKYSQLCNMVSEIVFDEYCNDRSAMPHGIRPIHIQNNLLIGTNNLYHHLREYADQEWGGFTSTILVQVFRQVAGSYNSLLTKYHSYGTPKKIKNKLLRKPTVFGETTPIQYNRLTMTFKLFDPSVVNNTGYGTLSTSGKRVFFEFIYGEHVQKHLMRIDADSGEHVPPWELSAYVSKYKKKHKCFPNLLKHKLTGAKLVHRKTKKGYAFFLQVTINKEVPPPVHNTAEAKLSQDNYLGVDLGITNLATSSNGTRFAGDKVDEIRVKHNRHRQGLQKRAKEVKSKHRNRIYRKIRQQGSKQAKFNKDTNHCISKRIVAEAKRTCTPVIVLENLSGIKGQLKAKRKQRNRMYSWSYAQLRQFIKYKAKLAGIRVIFIDPKHTSQKCHVCGHIERSNRGSGTKREQFICKACSHSAHADHNAALNIRDLGWFLDAA